MAAFYLNIWKVVQNWFAINFNILLLKSFTAIMGPRSFPKHVILLFSMWLHKVSFPVWYFCLRKCDWYSDHGDWWDWKNMGELTQAIAEKQHQSSETEVGVETKLIHSRCRYGQCCCYAHCHTNPNWMYTCSYCMRANQHRCYYKCTGMRWHGQVTLPAGNTASSKLALVPRKGPKLLLGRVHDNLAAVLKAPTCNHLTACRKWP